MSSLITSKRFAERWPFVAAILVLASLAGAILLPVGVPATAQVVCVIILDSLWSDVLILRVFGVGLSPSRWQFILGRQLILIPCLLLYVAYHTSGHLLAIGLFLALQVPLIVMRTKVSEPVIFKEPPSRRTQIVAGSMIFLSQR